jgi:hypothetical protein
LECKFFASESKNVSKQSVKIRKDGLCEKYVNVLEDGQIFLGLRDEGGFYGVGCLYDRKNHRLIEAGFYEGGVLHGYGLRNESESNS